MINLPQTILLFLLLLFFMFFIYNILICNKNHNILECDDQELKNFNN